MPIETRHGGGLLRRGARGRLLNIIGRLLNCCLAAVAVICFCFANVSFTTARRR